MKNETEKTYSMKEVRESMDKYMDSSIARLRLRLKSAWKKQATAIRSIYAGVKI